MVYGKLFAWKSNGNTLLYITVSINATGFGTTNDLQCNHCEKSRGQLLHASPSLFHPSSGPSGQLYIWNGEPKNWSLTQKSTILDNNVSDAVQHGVSAVQQQQMFLGNYRSSEMLFWPIDALWSCFTYTVDLSSVCDPWDAYGKGLFASGCTNRSDGLDASEDSQQDLTDSQTL
ncbi:hypothetical protein CEUSTIGMA_g729.t1 [Chlamydomonas eustigma]|uniref:Uncharacterized protein n=1 Tax=Chlamydomonas eustigma TaxID=1157962 RepID=A0A250WR06_9CHLO|nr:hypothetical protein CEUSTIGMA_g729.t1 [Chlamydomonas eustigma]|eukprot:GAX73275.1 hypothetical protein CEUSTIGMA_g729.t1 [Chlamydomonas eustigma]